MATNTAKSNSETIIYKKTEHGEDQLGYIGSDNVIYRRRWQEGKRVGRVEPIDPASSEGGITARILRDGQVDERELGTVDSEGRVRSHGLFEGGDLGWLEDSKEARGIVMRGGLIMTEEVVGRVEGPQREAAAAVLLLLFLPEDDEEDRRVKQSSL